MPPGLSPVGIVEVVKARVVVGFVIVKRSTFDVPPPGVGLKTVTEAVWAEVSAEAGTSATSWWELTKAVPRAAPFHFTTEVETNPVPFTVRANSGDPGATLVGTSG
jgi:hypothetical protein